MTNSHNKSGKNGSYAERYFSNHSPQQLNGGGGKRNNTSNSNNSGNGGRGHKSPSSNYFKSISNAIPIVQSTSPVSSKSGNYYNSGSPGGRHHSFNGNANYQRSSPGGAGFNSMFGSINGTLSGSPPNFSHFAGSKCYDAPAPTALPKPPVHWTSSVSSTTNTITSSSALNTSKTSINKPTSASVVPRNTTTSKASSSPSSTRSKAKSVKPAMSCAVAAAKANRNVDFTHNLKMILNVQA